MKIKQNKWALINLLGKTGSLSLLESLNLPKRYSELKHLTASDKTLAERLKELEENKLIETVSLKSGTRFFVHYQITSAGKKVLEKLNQFAVVK